MEIQNIREQVREVFDPLTKRLGLNGPIQSSQTSSSFHLGYTSKTIGLEIEVETLDFFIYALLYRPSGDILPVGYNDKTGKRQKLYIQQALKELAIDVSQETCVIQKLGGDYHNCRKVAEMLARLIEQHWQKLSQNSAQWFPK
jgi:hypothetical protein